MNAVMHRARRSPRLTAVCDQSQDSTAQSQEKCKRLSAVLRSCLDACPPPDVPAAQIMEFVTVLVAIQAQAYNILCAVCAIDSYRACRSVDSNRCLLHSDVWIARKKIYIYLSWVGHGHEQEALTFKGKPFHPRSPCKS